MNTTMAVNVFKSRLFYSCLRPGLWMASRLEVTLLCYRPLIFVMYMQLVSIRTTLFTQKKQWSLYHNKVTCSLAAISRPGHRADNYKMLCSWYISLPYSAKRQEREMTKFFQENVNQCFIYISNFILCS